MKTTTKTATRGICFALGLLTASSLAHAAGFAIYETDARGFAMGNANVGRNDDASALYSNPAAITQLPGLQVKAGVSFIMPNVEVTTFGSMDGQVAAGQARTTSLNSYTAVIPNFYATYRITDDIAVGLGVFVPYGLKSDFPDQPAQWPGAYNNFYTDVQTVELAPTIAYRLVHDQPWAKQISVAAGFAATRMDITIKRQMLLGLHPVSSAPFFTPLTLKGNGWECGYNLAVQYEVNDQLSFGIVYRSGFNFKITGARASMPALETAGFTGRSSSSAWGKINLPESWSFGVNYSPVVPLNLGFQALRTNWSSYDKLSICPFPELNPNANNTTKNWRDVWRYCFGAEYQLNNQVALRGSFVIDKDPVNTAHAEYMVPSNDRQLFCIGAGWFINKQLTIDASVGYIKIRCRGFDGRPADNVLPTFVHTGNAKILSISGVYRF